MRSAHGSHLCAHGPAEMFGDEMVANDKAFHRGVASRNLRLKPDQHQVVYFRLPDVVTISLNISLGVLIHSRKTLVNVHFSRHRKSAIDRR
jgi:hypothetical protein